MMSYRVIITPAMELDHTAGMERSYHDLHAAKVAKNMAADLLLFLQDVITVMPDYSNMIYIEQFVEGEWQEIEGD